ncbi:MAG: Type 1 glutamine amidotransferase-like domain-containing protein [Dehalococcoidia bacterium]
MGVVALMGGNEFQEDCIPLDQELLGMAKHPQRVVIVPTAAAFENPRKAAENGVRYFELLGTTATVAMILDRSDAEEPTKFDQLENADVVYLTGGSPAHLLRSMLGSRAARVIKTVFQRGGVIIGSSAGAMVLGQVMRGDITGTWVPGLGLVPQVAVRPHHRPGSDIDPRSVRQGLDTNVSILGIPTATACVSDGGNTLQVVGAKPVTVYSSDGVSLYSPGVSFTLAGVSG